MVCSYDIYAESGSIAAFQLVLRGILIANDTSAMSGGGVSGRSGGNRRINQVCSNSGIYTADTGGISVSAKIFL